MSIFNDLKPQGSQKLRPFDLSRRDVFSVKSGVLNVNFVQHTIPNAKYEVNHAQIMRTDAIQTAPFARMSENYEYYFIPYGQIFHDFERIYYERGDYQRNVSNVQFPGTGGTASHVPVFQYQSVVVALAKAFLHSRICRLMASQDSHYFENVMGSFRNSYTDYDLTRQDYFLDVHGEFCIDEMLKLFDMLGYGNLYPNFQTLLYSYLAFDVPALDFSLLAGKTTSELNDFVTAYNVQLRANLNACYGDYFNRSPQYSIVLESLFGFFSLIVRGSSDSEVLPTWQAMFEADELGTELAQIISFICDYDSISPAYNISYKQFVDSLVSYKPNIFALASYVKVFSDIYRNVQFDTDNYSALYNFDYVITDGYATVDAQVVLQMLIPRFRQYKKDVFTGVYPNAQFGSVAVSSLENPISIYNTTSESTNTLTRAGVNTSKSLVLRDSNSNFVTGSDKWFIDGGVSALAVRQALSLQRYKERILRAGNRMTALQTAVFGDRSRFIEDNYVQFIGAEHNIIDFNSVAATSDAGNSEVGQLGSNGIGTHAGKSFEFHSHDFGIILGIYYVIPETEYENYMIDPMNHKSESNDYYKPDFMNLGLSPVMSYDFNILGVFGENSGADQRVIGYLANYWEYKTAIDKVHGNFYATVPFHNLDADLLHNSPLLPSVLGLMRGSNAFYVTPRSSEAYRNGLHLSSLYCNPHDVDSIFYVNGDFTMDTDQFKVNCNHDVKALLPMSVVGLPEF